MFTLLLLLLLSMTLNTCFSFHLTSSLFLLPPPWVSAQALERQKEYTDAIRTERDELREETVKLKDILKVHTRKVCYRVCVRVCVSAQTTNLMMDTVW